MSLPDVVLRAMKSLHTFPQQVTKQHLQTIDAWIEEALKASLDSTWLLINRAELRELQERPIDAIAIYRQLLDRLGHDRIFAQLRKII